MVHPSGVRPSVRLLNFVLCCGVPILQLLSAQQSTHDAELHSLNTRIRAMMEKKEVVIGQLKASIERKDQQLHEMEQAMERQRQEIMEELQ